MALYYLIVMATDNIDATHTKVQTRNHFDDMTTVAAYIDNTESLAITEIYIGEGDEHVTIDHAI